MAKGIVYWYPERLSKVSEMLQQDKPILEIAQHFGKNLELIRMIISKHKLGLAKSTRGSTIIEQKGYEN
jgi:hypothetical protein